MLHCFPSSDFLRYKILGVKKDEEKKKKKLPLSIVTLYKSMMIMGNGHDFGHACDVCDVVLISLQRGEPEDVVLEMQSGKNCHKTVLF